jgi:hypothetical protein
VSTPKDELMVSNKQDRAYVRSRRTKLGCCASALLFIAAWLALAWFLGGCASTGQTATAKELQARWLAQQIRDMRRAQEGVVWSPPR